MSINLKADMYSVHSRLSEKIQDDEFANEWANLVPQITYLCREDYDFLVKTLENPPEPSEKLKALMRGEDYVDPNIEPA